MKNEIKTLFEKSEKQKENLINILSQLVDKKAITSEVSLNIIDHISHSEQWDSQIGDTESLLLTRGKDGIVFVSHGLQIMIYGDRRGGH